MRRVEMSDLELIEKVAKMRLALARFMVKNRCDERVLLEAMVNNEAVREAFRAGANALGGDDTLIIAALKELGLYNKYVSIVENTPSSVAPYINVVAVAPAPEGSTLDGSAVIQGHGAVLSALQALRYKEDDIDVANPIKYLYSRFGVHPDDATQTQLVEAMSAARIAVLNTASNAKSEFRSRRLNKDEMLQILALSKNPLLGTKKAQQDALKALCDALEAEKGAYWNTTQFLKKEKMSTEMHYGKEHTTEKVAGFIDSFFAGEDA